MLTEKINSDATTTFTHDGKDELTGATGGRLETYSYDDNGNRTMSGYSIGTANRITNDGVYTYSYDKEGNITKRSKGTTDDTWFYGYDHLNHMTWAELRAEDDDQSTLLMRADYDYDALGRRIEKAVDADGDGGGGTTTTRFSYLSEPYAEVPILWADLNGSSSLTTRYLRGDAVDQIFARIGSGTPAWLLQDHIGSIRNVVNNSGTILATVVYDSFGTMTSEEDADMGYYRYSSAYHDSETQLSFRFHRYYASWLGGWTGEDPIEFADGVNSRLYVHNNPLAFNDLTGLKVYLVGGHVGSKGVQDRDSGNSVLGVHYGIVVVSDDGKKLVRYDGRGKANLDIVGRPKPARNSQFWIDQMRKDFPEVYDATTRTWKFTTPELYSFDSDDDLIFEVDTGDTTFEQQVARLEAAFQVTWQLEYKGLTQNSNTYAHALLKRAGFKVRPFTVAVEDVTKRRKYITSPYDKPLGAVAWDNVDRYDDFVVEANGDPQISVDDLVRSWEAIPEFQKDENLRRELKRLLEEHGIKLPEPAEDWPVIRGTEEELRRWHQEQAERAAREGKPFPTYRDWLNGNMLDVRPIPKPELVPPPGLRPEPVPQPGPKPAPNREEDIRQWQREKREWEREHPGSDRRFPSFEQWKAGIRPTYMG